MKYLPLTNTDKVAIVDDDDFDVLSAVGPWRFQKSPANLYGYALNPTFGMHTLIMKLNGLWRHRQDVDHKNRCGLDNRKENLRMASVSQNFCNKALRRDNTSGFPGVRFDDSERRWVSDLELGSSNRNGIRSRAFGRRRKTWHKTLEEAVQSRLDKEKELFGEFRHNPFDLCPRWLDGCNDCGARFADLISDNRRVFLLAHLTDQGHLNEDESEEHCT